MHLSQHKLCIRKTGLPLGVKFSLVVHSLTPRTNESYSSQCQPWVDTVVLYGSASFSFLFLLSFDRNYTRYWKTFWHYQYGNCHTFNPLKKGAKTLKSNKAGPTHGTGDLTTICDLPDERGKGKTRTRLNAFGNCSDTFAFFSHYLFIRKVHIWYYDTLRRNTQCWRHYVWLCHLCIISWGDSDMEGVGRSHGSPSRDATHLNPVCRGSWEWGSNVRSSVHAWLYVRSLEWNRKWEVQ